jgi:hypothetical protein
MEKDKKIKHSEETKTVIKTRIRCKGDLGTIRE